MKNKILTVAHTKGGVGKSTILINIVIFLQKLGHDVWVLDLDPNRVTSAISGLRSNQNLKSFDTTVISSVNQFDNIILKGFDGIIIIDTAGVDNHLTRRAIEVSTLTIVPVAPSITEVIGFRTFSAVVDVLKIDTKKIKILLNQTHPRATKFESFKHQLGNKFDYFNTALPRLGDFVHSLGSGLGVVELKDKKDKSKMCRAGLSIKALTDEILEVIND